MTTVKALVAKLSNPENKWVLEAVAELRMHGGLSDGSLAGCPLCYSHLEGADLHGADLQRVDLHQAHLEGADLSGANLRGAELTRARLQGANLSGTNFADADLFKANLSGARNVTDEQLASARRLWGAIMCDGSSYDGRYSLPGDLEFASWGGIDVTDSQAMADFFRVPLEVYLQGQKPTAMLVA
jgi:uncharacterized protein YjbI with pentapeptide repeats